MMAAQAVLATVAILLAPCAGTKAKVASSARELERDLSANLDGERPVAKVVRMLQDMKAELEKEMADDEAVFSMLTCWCKTNDEEKTKAIEVAVANIANLEASLSATAAKVVELKEKRKATMDELYSDQKALGSAEAIRMQENKAFHGEETDLLEAISACKGAITALSKHQTSLGQVQTIVHQLRKARVQELAMGATVSAHTGPALAHARAQALKEFLDGVEEKSHSQAAFMSVPGFQSYAPASGQIFGILQQMQKDFESSLSDAQKAELAAKTAFEQLKAAKLDEIAAAKKMVADLDEQVAALGEKAAQEAKELEDTKEQLGMDQQFLADLKARCSETDAEFESRKASRLEEIVAVEEALKICNSDEAFGVFEKTTKGFVPDQAFEEASATVSFVQTDEDSVKAQVRRTKASQLLQKAAEKSNLPRLSLLASMVQLNTFSKVIAEVEKLVAELSVQQKDEVKHRDWCIAELADNEQETAATDHRKENLVQKETDLTHAIEELGEKIALNIAETKEAQEQMKRASEIREAENADFQEVVQDQRLTQMILSKALARLKEVYALMQQRATAVMLQEEPQPGAAHIATSGNHTNAGNAPARFTKYEKNAGGARVVVMLEKIIADSQKLENEAVAAETEAQSVYEDFMKRSNKELTQYAETLQSMQSAKATAEGDLSMTKTDLKDTLKGLEGLNQYLGDLRKSCDFIMKNFDARQEARAAEIEALGEAKAILSGMN